MVRGEDEQPAWTTAQFEEEMAQSVSWQLVACHGKSGQISGYICMRTVVDESEIVKLAVIKNIRRQGVASKLLQAAIRQMAKDGCRSCFLEVRESNLAARGLYEKFGFRRTGLRKKYYSDPHEDGLIYTLVLQANDL